MRKGGLRLDGRLAATHDPTAAASCVNTHDVRRPRGILAAVEAVTWATPPFCARGVGLPVRGAPSIEASDTSVYRPISRSWLITSAAQA